MNTKELRKQALAIVKEQAVVSTTRGDRKNMFLELLKGKTMKRDEVVGEIAWSVYDKANPGIKEIDAKEFQKVIDSVKGSVANFCSASKRKSTATATFNWDPAYKEWELVKHHGGMLEIKERETAFVTFE